MTDTPMISSSCWKTAGCSTPRYTDDGGYILDADPYMGDGDAQRDIARWKSTILDQYEMVATGSPV